MAWENCVVSLNSDSTGSFYTGDIVTGTVFLEFKHRQKVENIEFLVIGTSKAKWTRPSPVMPFIKFYSEKKRVLYIKVDVFEDIRGKTINADVYTYPFHFVLPEDLPSTFESGIATVEYYIKIKGQGVWGHKKVTPFVVLGNVNINHDEKYLKPSNHEIHKKCWNTDTVACYVKTFTAFASKQVVPFEVRVENKKKVRISNLSVKLIQKIRYSIKDGHASEERQMSKDKYVHFVSETEERCSFSIDIPHVTPSSIYLRDPMIDISYVLRITLKFLYHSTVYEDIPVTVSTAPVIHYDFAYCDEDD